MNPWDVPTVDVSELPAGAVILDVREPDEWAHGHIDGAVHVPMNSLPQRLAYEPGPITPDTPVVVVCKVGGRSAHVTAWLNRQGYDAVNLDGGMLAWAAAGRPMVSETGDAPMVA
ncbi:MAG: rhodanese-like domain-containing protein [Jatrophihabitans sp.]|uniref:rhodanese-like domain-containing protein n=1 Tax=Jatrophihabitans sp. TaxID=1932789 RepID=UPI003F7E117C